MRHRSKRLHRTITLHSAEESTGSLKSSKGEVEHLPPRSSAVLPTRGSVDAAAQRGGVRHDRRATVVDRDRDGGLSGQHDPRLPRRRPQHRCPWPPARRPSVATSEDINLALNNQQQNSQASTTSSESSNTSFTDSSTPHARHGNITLTENRGTHPTPHAYGSDSHAYWHQNHEVQHQSAKWHAVQ